ncbi:MAG: hypothetical protein UX08_C0004G0010 [Candidatus Collierbacteria bacterium GW2011_GWB1_45_35]|uniref:Uncharacterized protein n=2 Tax=Candidatus Collieribacteriota TaxID=1752725 RepID=A0A0G1KQ30_9BACT|nr:MAG: hypothetical protein UW48_C0002G0090 [Microgenomates group bacterium GW2011_GWC1_44_23]KKT85618.1 MAG: hypothetical protein UW84_C0026G0006 [Candidatus Collierbacteria bacterium GW2011_GWA2_44_99]KKT95654.1 MAG: hypothetical protein UW96_C0006G0085 [Candidatus Collierbacteria bacterium GW2011_GWA1_45_15]KKU00446.1 MAG: hypothetical protein UX01_C0004G0013 [Candidatus Collierbacteria bacterium GW2011_GWB2_45_17]KKU05547.1 MAG: hypothetical protein UX08_C0004G0010 [Candidatus Collierbacte
MNTNEKEKRCLNGQKIRNFLRKYRFIAIVLGWALSMGAGYVFIEVFTVSDVVGTTFSWITFILYFIWISNGIGGLKKILGLTVSVTKWLLAISIVFLVISLAVGWVNTISPTTIIIILLLLILAR